MKSKIISNYLIKDGFNASMVLDAVEKWADGKYFLIRETGIIPIGMTRDEFEQQHGYKPLVEPKANGRLDGLLVPISNKAHCMKFTKENFFDRI